MEEELRYSNNSPLNRARMMMRMMERRRGRAGGRVPEWDPEDEDLNRQDQFMELEPKLEREMMMMEDHPRFLHRRLRRLVECGRPPMRPPLARQLRKDMLDKDLNHAQNNKKENRNSFWETQSKDEVSMAVDTCEDDWERLHDIELNGSILEYVGRGNGITDVGLAQTKEPLDTQHHFFEIEIVDPGENCYIAIGLASKTYPKHRHPGWNKGSVAYHADDGKIFIGRGTGSPFGPRCNKGDIMGCGIFFPRNYFEEYVMKQHLKKMRKNIEKMPSLLSMLTEMDDISDESSSSDDDTGADEDSHSEDEEWWDREHIRNKGPPVEVFFTRNGKLIGKKQMRIPKGGFYPTIGMLSLNEKVRVDLRPLTG